MCTQSADTGHIDMIDITSGQLQRVVSVWQLTVGTEITYLVTEENAMTRNDSSCTCWHYKAIALLTWHVQRARSSIIWRCVIAVN